jgi:hypothetical protein
MCYVQSLEKDLYLGAPGFFDHVFTFFRFKNATIFCYDKHKFVALQQRGLKVNKCELLLWQDFTSIFEACCIGVCDKSIQGPIVVFKCLENIYYTYYEHGS